MLNKCMIIGNLGQDPEMRYTANGNAVTTMSVATSRQWSDASGQKQEETEWFRVVAWNKLAEVCSQYLAKGKRVYVEGRLQTRQWEDQQGIKRYTTELIAQEVKFLSPSDGGGGNREYAGAAQYDQQPQAGDFVDDDDLPF